SPDGSTGVAAGGTSLNLTEMPPAVRLMYENALGDATGVVFMTSAIVAVIGLVCILFIKEVPLRRTV
ncbi:MAG: MFS transporter, partial [Paeniglutamicibacter sp.]